MKPCSEDYCDVPSYAKGLCPKHYNRKRFEAKGECSREGCSSIQRTHGVCSKHWNTRTPDNPEEVCSVEGCNIGYSIKTPINLCRSHYGALRGAYGPRCTVDGCEKRVKAKRKCGTHYEHDRSITTPCSIEGCEEIAGNRFQKKRREPDFRHLCRKHHVLLGKPGKLVRTRLEVEEDIKAQAKICHSCGDTKPFSAFFNGKAARDGKAGQCKDCADDWRYRKEFGITKEQRDAKEEEQDGKCAICKQRSDKTLHIDHCHTTGTVRGLLCYSCNVGIAFLRENTETLQSAILYLNHPWKDAHV